MSEDHRTDGNLKTRVWDWGRAHSGEEPQIGRQWCTDYMKPVQWELSTSIVLDNWLFGLQIERDRGAFGPASKWQPHGPWPRRLWITLGFGPFYIALQREWKVKS